MYDFLMSDLSAIHPLNIIFSIADLTIANTV